MSYGTVSNFEDSATVRFERTIAVPVGSAWQAISALNARVVTTLRR